MRLKSILEQDVLCFDGGFGTMADARKLISPCPEKLHFTHPADIVAIHRAYVEAGAKVIETNSLGGTPAKLAEHGLEEQCEMLATMAVQHAKEAADGLAWVAYSAGTIGQFLAPLGTLTVEEAIAQYQRPLKAARDAGADLFIIETITDIADMRMALMAAVPLGLPVIASYSYSQNGRLLTGGTPASAALSAAALGAAALGINCSTGPEDMVAPLLDMRLVCPLPVIVQPNAGIPQLDAEGNTVFPLSPQDMLPDMQALLEAGAAGIGGCCGTTPEHIRAFAKLCEDRHPPAPTIVNETWLCSQREKVPLKEALSALAVIRLEDEDVSLLYDLPECKAVLLDLTEVSAEEAAEAVTMAQMATTKTMLFQTEDAQVATAALRAYHGRSALLAPASMDGVARPFGAVLVSDGLVAD